ncbi:hypothetical protein D9Q98_008082 [Chlorella vulgaris]|uniref:Uncharacterized protein n=1 Tax=Chlorella vulgaris TaxID=3077 RepID=A0A9D4TFY8_CHLVU|nr:hypothetical protein D9Q98_008082 [Chlorella vulgaris]
MTQGADAPKVEFVVKFITAGGAAAANGNASLQNQTLLFAAAIAGSDIGEADVTWDGATSTTMPGSGCAGVLGLWALAPLTIAAPNADMANGVASSIWAALGNGVADSEPPKSAPIPAAGPPAAAASAPIPHAAPTADPPSALSSPAPPTITPPALATITPPTPPTITPPTPPTITPPSPPTITPPALATITPPTPPTITPPTPPTSTLSSPAQAAAAVSTATPTTSTTRP